LIGNNNNKRKKKPIMIRRNWEEKRDEIPHRNPSDGFFSYFALFDCLHK
jgi:hypothetical protein